MHTTAAEERAPKLIAEAAELLKLSVSYGESPTGAKVDGGWDSGLFSKEVEGLHTPRDGFAHYDVLSAHTGLHNRRWRCHLGLKLAKSHTARLYVANQMREWEVGSSFRVSSLWHAESTS